MAALKVSYSAYYAHILRDIRRPLRKGLGPDRSVGDGRGGGGETRKPAPFHDVYGYTRMYQALRVVSSKGHGAYTQNAPRACPLSLAHVSGPFSGYTRYSACTFMPLCQDNLARIMAGQKNYPDSDQGHGSFRRDPTSRSTVLGTFPSIYDPLLAVKTAAGRIPVTTDHARNGFLKLRAYPMGTPS